MHKRLYPTWHAVAGLHHFHTVAFWLRLLCIILLRLAFSPFLLCPFCSMFTCIAWASRKVGADAPHRNRTRSFDHDVVPLSQKKTIVLDVVENWRVLSCGAANFVRCRVFVGALATPWPDRQRDLQVCDILGLQTVQSWSLPWWNLENQIMAAVALTFVFGVDRASNCCTLQNHCRFEIGEKLSKNYFAKERSGTKWRKILMDVLVKPHNHWNQQLPPAFAPACFGPARWFSSET